MSYQLYRIVAGDSPRKVEEAVNDLLLDGFTLVGQPFAISGDEGLVGQALIKTTQVCCECGDDIALEEPKMRCPGCAKAAEVTNY